MTFRPARASSHGLSLSVAPVLQSGFRSADAADYPHFGTYRRRRERDGYRHATHRGADTSACDTPTLEVSESEKTALPAAARPLPAGASAAIAAGVGGGGGGVSEGW